MTKAYYHQHRLAIIAAVWQYTERNKEKLRAKVRERKYGITAEDCAVMVANQGGLCAICGRMEDDRGNGRNGTLSIDHDHTTGRHRGLLCTACNTGLGKFRDSPALLRKAEIYLWEWSTIKIKGDEQCDSTAAKKSTASSMKGALVASSLDECYDEGSVTLSDD